jgi:hypothetical protein
MAATNGTSSGIYYDADYSPILSNWYTSQPYGFTFTDSSGNTTTINLPINPSNLTISTSFATVLTPTLYGTVEEHSSVRYYDISIEGNTGFGPKWIMPSTNPPVLSALNTRSVFSVQQSLSPASAAGFFMKTLALAAVTASDTNNLLSGFPDPIPGLQLDQTGYLAFHNLYRFLLAYKKDVAANGAQANVYPLVFFNYKDSIEYNVVVKSFTMKRDLYHYSIQLRGFDLGDAGRTAAQDSSNLNTMLGELGLYGIQSSNLLADLMNVANQARGILASVGTGVSSLGS